MAARTGAEYLSRLKADPREVWISGERVDDVTTHPAFRNGAKSTAALYDMQHDTELRDEMTYPSPTTGDPVGMSFLTPRTVEDLERRHQMMSHWARFSGGMLGRTPDYLNVILMTAAAAKYLEENRPGFGTNMVAYYEHVRENDLALTHTLVNMRRSRSPDAEQEIGLRVIEEKDSGIVVRGARVLATLGPISDEIMVFPSTVVLSGPDAHRMAFAFCIPCATPGLKFICRETFDLGRSQFDHPLGSRFDEADAVVLFDDVHVPWERVFLLGDVDKSNNMSGDTNAVIHMMHQVAIKDVAKAEFVLGVASLMARTVGSEANPDAQGRIAELIIDLETIKACLRAAEADAQIDRWGVMVPSRHALDMVRVQFPRMYPRMVEILQLLGSSNLIAIPSEDDFDTPLLADLERYFSTDQATGRERVQIFRLAWDIACSAFGGRQVLYERFFFSDPSRVTGALFREYDREPLIDRVREFLRRS